MDRETGSTFLKWDFLDLYRCIPSSGDEGFFSFANLPLQRDAGYSGKVSRVAKPGGLCLVHFNVLSCSVSASQSRAMSLELVHGRHIVGGLHLYLGD